MASEEFSVHGVFGLLPGEVKPACVPVEVTMPAAPPARSHEVHRVLVVRRRVRDVERRLGPAELRDLLGVDLLEDGLVLRAREAAERERARPVHLEVRGLRDHAGEALAVAGAPRLARRPCRADLGRDARRVPALLAAVLLRQVVVVVERIAQQRDALVRGDHPGVDVLADELRSRRRAGRSGQREEEHHLPRAIPASRTGMVARFSTTTRRRRDVKCS